MTGNDRLSTERFPRSSTYHPEWVLASMSGGANSLWLTEWLAEVVPLQVGMRVLDLGCGRGASSVFLRREFGVQVWATDLWFNAADRLQRVRDAGVDDGVFPISAEARSLPFPPGFFDAIVSIDSFPYYGTDDLYASYVAQFVKEGGPIAIAGAGLVQEIDGPIPDHLRRWWEPAMCCLHSAEWWRGHWSRSGVLDVELADIMLDGWRVWLDWQQTACPDNRAEIEALEGDGGRYLGYVRVVGRRRPGVRLEQLPQSVPVEYTKMPLLRRQDGQPQGLASPN